MSISLDGITLPQALVWADEYEWSPVSQGVKKTLTGALIVVEQKQLKGREITLQGDPESTWINKADLELLRAKANTADLTMTLSYHGTNYSVMFLRSQTPIDAQLIVPFENPQPDDVYNITLRLMEV
ncbi:MAG: hypothetical protein COA83_09730 [Methylophaga sp.]|nr:MAG: hypothetical protein COA83_09730 [Methylophaga sp.]